MLVLKPVESRVVEILAASDKGLLYRVAFVSIYDLFNEKEVYDKLRKGEIVKVELNIVEEKRDVS